MRCVHSLLLVSAIGCTGEPPRTNASASVGANAAPDVVTAVVTDGTSNGVAGPLRVHDAWVRATNVTHAAAMYLSLENRDSVDVHVVGASSPEAKSVTLHETMEMQGMSHMAAVPDLLIARGTSVTLQPGGLHLMLGDVARALVNGDTVPLDLQLADGRTTHVVAIVRAP